MTVSWVGGVVERRLQPQPQIPFGYAQGQDDEGRLN